jgi:signal transduction histidine kinase
LLGYAYFHIAGEAYALVSIGLISFAAVAQFAPALLGGLYWKGGTQRAALAGLLAGFLMWGYTLMLPSIAKSGWMDAGFIQHGAWGLAWLRPEQLLGLQGLDSLTHALFWSLLVNTGVYVGVSLWRPPSGQEASQALLFVDVFKRSEYQGPVFWQGHARVADLRRLCQRFLGAEQAAALWARHAPDTTAPQANARLVQWVETQLAGAVGSASARALVASVAEEVPLSPEDVLRIVDEGSQLRHANEQLKSLDRLKDDFMSSVTHELRTPLTSIRALAELMRDDTDMDAPQRQQFVGIIVSETERLSRLVNQVLDMAKIESGHAEWHNSAVDMRALVGQAATTTTELFRERQCRLTLDLPPRVRPLMADPDRLTQVLLNLLSNAAKFVPVPGGEVTLRLVSDEVGLTVSVHDNGPGVPAVQQALIFEKFRQGGDATNRPQGTGLGLPISRQIVEHFGGRLWLASGGSGACFCFSLPWSPTHNNTHPEGDA